MTPGQQVLNEIPGIGRVASDVWRIRTDGVHTTAGSITAVAVISANNNIEFRKTVEPAPANVGGMSVVSPGNNVTYTIIITQLGTNGYARVWISDTLGDGITFTGQPIYNGSNPAYKGEYITGPFGANTAFSVTIDITEGLTNRNDRAWQLIAKTTPNYTSVVLPVRNYLTMTYEKDITSGIQANDTFYNAGQAQDQNKVFLGATQITMSKKVVEWPAGKTDGLVTVMDVLTYEYVIANLGSISLSNLVLTDNLIGNIVITPNLVLTNNDSITLHAGYQVQGAHAVGRNITNTATFTGVSLMGAINGITMVTTTVQTTFLITSVPDITLEKVVSWTRKGDVTNPYTPTVGDYITYTYHITSLYAGNIRYGNIQDSRLNPKTDLRKFHDAAYGSSLASGNQFTLTPLSSTVFSMVVRVT
jgi:uncharacterized repeat protein (TIGR01451 family)